MSLLVISLGLASGILLGRAIGRTLRRGEGDSRAVTASARAPHEEGARARPSDPETPSGPIGTGGETSGSGADDGTVEFPCHLGDVLLATTGDEAWLAGALVFRERLPAGMLFIAPDAGGDRAIFVRPLPQSSLLWLTPTDPGSLVVGREPPTSLEHEHERFERTRRVPYHIERIGTGAPDLGREGIVAEYKAITGERILVVVGSDETRAWRGRPLEEGMYDVLPGSPATTDKA